MGGAAASARVARVETTRFANRVAEGRERVAHRPGARELVLEARAERAARLLHAAGADDQTGDVLAAEDAVHPPGEAPMHRGRVVSGAGGARPEAREGVVELCANRLHVAERDARGEQRHHLLVAGIAVAMHDAYRIRGEPLRDVAARAHLFEDVADFRRPGLRALRRARHGTVGETAALGAGSGSLAARASAATR